jgi:hypothetical protein
MRSRLRRHSFNQDVTSDNVAAEVSVAACSLLFEADRIDISRSDVARTRTHVQQLSVIPFTVCFQ